MPPNSGGVSTVEPVSIPHIIEDETRQSYIEIHRRSDRALIAVLELLSPSNKNESGRGQYLAKRSALLRQDVHLFELDLLLGGQRLPLQDPLPPGDYYAMISRGNRRPDCEVYAWIMGQPLPILPIPLQAPDPDILLDFREVYEATYKRGRYAEAAARDTSLQGGLR